MSEPILKSAPIVKALHGAFCGDASREELLRMAAAKIYAAGPPYNGVYMYMLHGDELLLEAHEGRRTDLTKIPVGQGMCGKAVAERHDLNIPDVSQAEGYLACSIETRSELVVLIRRHDEILGQIDIDSDLTDPFTGAEEAAVREVADALAALL
jgi:GAF domain-containing protein